MDIPHNRPSFNHKETLAAQRVINSGWVAQGKRVEEFEAKFCDYVGLPHGHSVAVSSGSSALYIAILALEAKERRIGLPVYTCAAVNNAVKLAGGKSIFIDNSATGPNLDMEIANRTELHTLIAVSTFGIPLSIPVNRDYRVLEDISQALGANVGDQKLGVAGDIGICSFSATKLITTGGQGGMIFSSNKSLVEFARDYRDFDAREDRLPRFNFQMTDIQAAIGTAQLKKLPNFLQKREEIFEIYTDSGLNLEREAGDNLSAVRYRAVIRHKDPLKIKARLSAEGIKSIIPFTFHELLSTSSNEKNAVNYSNTTLSIPIYPTLSLKQARKIAKVVYREMGIY
jgi:perosamine synthetase